MPKLLNEKTARKYHEFCELRRNLRNMTLEDMERYAKGESLSRILGKKYNHGLR